MGERRNQKKTRIYFERFVNESEIYQIKCYIKEKNLKSITQFLSLETRQRRNHLTPNCRRAKNLKDESRNMKLKEMK